MTGATGWIPLFATVLLLSPPTGLGAGEGDRRVVTLEDGQTSRPDRVVHDVRRVLFEVDEKELLVRVQSLIRRSTQSAAPTRLKAGDLEVDLLSRTVRRAGRVVELQPREYSLLEYLLRNADRVLSKTMIMEHVWDYDFDPQTNVVDVLVSRLRSKIDKDFDEKLIQTVRGVGYVLRSPRG